MYINPSIASVFAIFNKHLLEKSIGNVKFSGTVKILFRYLLRNHTEYFSRSWSAYVIRLCIMYITWDGVHSFVKRTLCRTVLKASIPGTFDCHI